MKLLPKNLRVRSQGMTLVELMFTLTLLSVLMMFAVPSFNGALASNRLTSTTNTLYASFVEAKNQAPRLGKRVTVCASDNGTQCSNNANGWQNGWITFVDETRTSIVSVSVDTGETVLAVTQAAPDRILISGSGGLAYISFSADQRSRDLGGGFLASTFRICSTAQELEDDARHRQISTIASGSLRVKTPKELAVSLQSVDRTCPALP